MTSQRQKLKSELHTGCAGRCGYWYLDINTCSVVPRTTVDPLTVVAATTVKK